MKIYFHNSCTFISICSIHRGVKYAINYCQDNEDEDLSNVENQRRKEK